MNVQSLVDWTFISCWQFPVCQGWAGAVNTGGSSISASYSQLMGRWSVRNRCSFLLVLLLLQYFINKYLSFYLLTKINFNLSLMFPYTLGKDSQSIPKFINSTLTLDQKSVPSCNIIKTKVLVSHFNWKKLDQCIPSHELQLVTQKKVCWVNPQRSGEELTVETLLLLCQKEQAKEVPGRSN